MTSKRLAQINSGDIVTPRELREIYFRMAHGKWAERTSKHKRRSAVRRTKRTIQRASRKANR